MYFQNNMFKEALKNLNSKLKTFVISKQWFPLNSLWLLNIMITLDMLSFKKIEVLACILKLLEFT